MDMRVIMDMMDMRGYLCSKFIENTMNNACRKEHSYYLAYTSIESVSEKRAHRPNGFCFKFVRRDLKVY
jgi:hypothetical protein